MNVDIFAKQNTKRAMSAILLKHSDLQIRHKIAVRDLTAGKFSLNSLCIPQRVGLENLVCKLQMIK